MIHQAIKPIAWHKTGIQILLGSLYVALLSQVEVPLKPVPMTLQTFAIFSLALFQGSKKSFFSLIAYLCAATVGLPVLPVAYSNPLWILEPTAGYCLSFPLAAYIAGRFTEFKRFSIGLTILGLFCAQFCVYLLGVSWLSFSIGWQQALACGFYPFIGLGLIKMLAAFSIKMAVRPAEHLYQILVKQWEKFYERF